LWLKGFKNILEIDFDEMNQVHHIFVVLVGKLLILILHKVEKFVLLKAVDFIVVV